MTDDTVFLALRSGNSGFCADYQLGMHVRPPVVPPKGFMQPLGVGAASVAMLSRLGDAQIDSIIASNTKRLASYGLSAATVSDLVQRTRGAGYAKVGNYVTPGVIALGTSVNDAIGRPMLSLSVATTASRMSRHHQSSTLDALFAEADTLRRQISRDAVLREFLVP